MNQREIDGQNEAGTTAREPILSQVATRDTTALVRTIRDKLRLAIALGELPGGSRLNQVQLSKQLGVSRMPIRTALAELLAEGVLQDLPGGGVTVRSLTEADLRDAYEVRGALESRAVRHVAEQHSAWRIARIERIVETHKPLVLSYDAAELLHADREFHMAILDATDNSFYRRSIMPVWLTVERVMVELVRIKEVLKRAWEEHEQIAQALRDGDADRAESLMGLHLEAAVRDLAGALHTGPDSRTVN